MNIFNNEVELEKPQLIIPLASYQKIMAYAEIATGEITGFADVDYNTEKKALVVGEVYLLEQEAAAAHVEMNEEIVADFNLQMVKKGLTQLPRLWWHSHVDMETFFSGTDDDTILDLKNDSFMVALVVNKKRKMHALLNFCAPIPLIIDNLPISVDFGLEEVPEELRKEVQRKVKEPPSVFSNFLTKGWEKKKGEESIMYFPKDIASIKKRIKEFGLKREWDTDSSQHIWKSPKTGTIWVDFHNVILNPFNDEFDTPDEDTSFEREIVRIKKKSKKKKRYD